MGIVSHRQYMRFDSFRNDKTTEKSALIIELTIATLNTSFEENIAGKIENAGYKHFLLFSQCFKKHVPRCPLNSR